MSRLPRFRATQQIQPGPTPVSTQGRGLTQFAQQIQQTEQKQFLQQQVQKAETAGELAGLQPGFQPVAGGSEAQRAFNQAALATNKQQIATNVMLNIEKFKQQSISQNPDAAVAYQQFNALAQQHSAQVLQAVPEQNRAYAQNLLTHQIGSAQLELQQRALKQQKLKANAQAVQTLNTYDEKINDSINNINWSMGGKDDTWEGVGGNALVGSQVNAAGALLAQKQQTASLMLEGGQITKREFDAMNKNDQVNFRQNIILSQLRSKLNDGTAEPFLKKLTSQSIPGLSETQQQTVLSKAFKMRSQFNNADQQNKALVAKNTQDYIFGIQNGAPRNVRMESTFNRTFPEKSGLLQEQVQDAQKLHDTVSGILSLPFAKQQEALDHLRPTDKDDPDFGRNLKNWNSANSMIAQARHKITTDPFPYFASQPNMVHTYNEQAAQNDAGVDLNSMSSLGGFKPLSKNPKEAMVVAQLQYGLPLNQTKIVSNENAKLMVNNFNGLAPQQQVNQLAQWQREYGQTFPILMRNLQHDGKMKSMDTFLVGVSPNDTRLPDVVQAMNTDVPTLKKALDPSKFEDLETAMTPGFFTDQPLDDFINSLGAFKSVSTAAYVAKTRTLTQKIAMSMMINDSSLSAKDAWQQASGFITDRFNFDSINGSPIRIPKQFDPGAVKFYAQEEQKKIKDFPFVISQDAKGLPNARQVDFNTTIKTGHWATNAQNTGLIWVNNQGSAMHDGKGHTFQIFFKDASNSSARALFEEEQKNKKQVNSDILNYNPALQ